MTLGMKCVFEYQDLQMFRPKLSECMSNFHPREVVGRGIRTHL